MAATRLSFSYPIELKEQLLELAANDSRTLSSYVQKLITDHIEENESKITFKKVTVKDIPKPVKKKVKRKVKR